MFTMAQWLNWRWLFSRRRERIEISVETKESWEVHWFKKSRAELCPLCEAETIFIPFDLGAQIIQTEVEEIENLVRNGKVHFRQTAEMEKLICLSSLKKSMEKNSTQNFLKEKGENL